MEISERAHAFEDAFPLRISTVGGFDWSYYIGGQGDPVLLLTGGAGIGIAWMDLALALKDRHRLIAIDFPAAPSFFTLADGLAELLTAEGIVQAHVVGQSMGGMLAEVLSRQAPAKVRSLALTGAGLYGEEDQARLEGKKLYFETTPWEQVREATRQALQKVWAGSPEADFWIARIDAANAGEQGRLKTLSPYLAFLELIDRLPTLQAAPSWSGPVLFLRAEDDPLITEQHFQRLSAMHPNAEIRRYDSGGHSLLLTRAEDYIRDIGDFLARH